MKREEKLGWAVYWLGIAFILVCVSLALAGCGGSNIPLDAPEEPVSCEVADECVDEVVADFCPGPVDPPVCEECDPDAGLQEGYETGYEAGFLDGYEAATETEDHCWRGQYVCRLQKAKWSFRCEWQYVRYECSEPSAARSPYGV